MLSYQAFVELRFTDEGQSMTAPISIKPETFEGT